MKSVDNKKTLGKKTLELSYSEAINSLLGGSFAQSSFISQEIFDKFKEIADKNRGIIIDWIKTIPGFNESHLLTKPDGLKLELKIEKLDNMIVFSQSPSAVTTGKQSSSRIMSHNINNKLDIIEPVINEINISLRNNPEYSLELSKLKDELKKAKTEDEKCSKLMKIATWFSEHLEDIANAGQIVNKILNFLNGVLH